MTDKAKKAQAARDAAGKADMAQARAAGARMLKRHENSTRQVGEGEYKVGAGALTRPGAKRSLGGTTTIG